MNEELKAQRETLKEEAEQYRNNIKAQINGTVDNVENTGKNVLIASSILLVGYGLFSLLSQKEQPTEYIPQVASPTPPTGAGEQAPAKQVYVKPKKQSYFGKLLKEQLVMMVVDVARKSIKDILSPIEPSSKKTKKED